MFLEKKETPLKRGFCFCGEGGIRTPGTLLGVRQFSKLLLSATQAPLQFLKMERKSKKKSVP
jgi:hypothetical protein